MILSSQLRKQLLQMELARQSHGHERVLEAAFTKINRQLHVYL